MDVKEQRKVDDFIVYAMAAADEALADSNWHPESYEDQVRSGVLIGSGIGGLNGIAEGTMTIA
jgi:3-oxoacyl-[acyl-carrier-protein] synthase II